MSKKELEKLVEFIGKNTGLQQEEKKAELTKELINSIDNLNKSTTKYSKIIIKLTAVLFIVAVLQILISLFLPCIHW